MRKKISLGDRFGRLVVISEGEPKFIGQCNRSTWNVVCDCGNSFNIMSQQLKGGITKSCGCLQRETTGNRRRIHGMYQSPEYKSWHNMMQRCTNPKAKRYESYGGRGITVCLEWNSFENFFNDMGSRPTGTSIDRIDVNENYKKENCRWATTKEQSSNTTRTVNVELNGEKIPFAWAAQKINVPEPTLRLRMNNLGWTHQKIIDAQWVL